MDKFAVLMLANVPGEEGYRNGYVVVEARPDTDPARAHVMEGAYHLVLDGDAANAVLSLWEGLAPYRGYVPGDLDAGWSWFVASVPGDVTGTRIIHEEWEALRDADGNRVNEWSTYDLGKFDSRFYVIPESQFEQADIIA